MMSNRPANVADTAILLFSLEFLIDVDQDQYTDFGGEPDEGNDLNHYRNTQFILQKYKYQMPPTRENGRESITIRLSVMFYKLKYSRRKISSRGH